MSKLDVTYMNVAAEMAKLSKCISHQVAAVIVKDGRIISTGINGTPPGFHNCCDEFEHVFQTEYSVNHDREVTLLEMKGVPERHHEWSNIHEIHAEQNAISNAAKHGIAVEGSTVYCTLKPCRHCTKLLISSGIRKVIYRDVYKRHNDPAIDEMFDFCNIEVEQLLMPA